MKRWPNNSPVVCEKIAAGATEKLAASAACTRGRGGKDEEGEEEGKQEENRRQGERRATPGGPSLRGASPQPRQPGRRSRSGDRGGASRLLRGLPRWRRGRSGKGGERERSGLWTRRSCCRRARRSGPGRTV